MDKLPNFIKFLGTAGARFVVLKQLRASGGFILNLDDVRIHIDPGPGAIVRLNASKKPKLKPENTDAVLLSHRHIDHTNDVNIIIEGMTEGGTVKRGTLIAPSSCLDSDDPVVLRYAKEYIGEIRLLKEGKEISLNNISIKPLLKLNHGIENYAIEFSYSPGKILYISDTKYFEFPFKKGEFNIIIINTVLLEERQSVLHLSVQDAKKIIKQLSPEIAFITHFGMQMVKSEPWKIAEYITKELGIKTIAASDGMYFELDKI